MKDISNYEGLYAITSCGKVWSYRSKKFLSQSYDSNGYPMVNLSNGGKVKTVYIHRLVAEAYIPNPEGKPQVDHLDEVKTHNWVGNLAWATPGENSRRTNMGRKRTWSSIIRPIYCVELDRYFKSQAEARREFGMKSSAPLHNALNGKRNTCGGYHWRYANEEEIGQSK